MPRQTTRLGLMATIAAGLRAALRRGGPSLSDRVAATPRMVAATLRGDYRSLGWRHLALLVGAAFYVVSPLDLVPEALFSIFGVVDDAVVATWLVAALMTDTEDFLAWEQQTSGPQDSRTGFGQGRQGRPEPQDAPAGAWGPTVTSHVVG